MQITRLFSVISTVVIFFAISAKAQTYQGTATVSGSEGVVLHCQEHGGCTSSPAVGSLQITADGQSVTALAGASSTSESIANSLCNQMTSSFPVQCSGVTGSGTNYSLQMTAPANHTISSTTYGNTTFGIATPIVDVIDPAYYVLSVMAVPPGNQSSNGYVNSTSYGVQTSMASTFGAGQSISFSIGGGFFATTTYGVSFGITDSTTDSTAFQVTYQNGSGSSVNAARDVVNTQQDQIFLLLNPEVSTTQTAASQGIYSVGSIAGQPPDVVNVSVAELLDPPSIPIGLLEPRTVNGVTVPGLMNVCANPLPVNQCTQNNACGCVASDFAAIVAQDALNTSPNGTAQQPSVIDPVRFPYVQSTNLEGPACSSGCSEVSNVVNLNDSSMTTNTQSSSVQYTVGFTRSTGFKALGFSLTYASASTVTYTNTVSQGTSTGQSHQATITLKTNSVGCFEDVDIYEDEMYHTFVGYVPSVQSSCMN